MAPRLLCVAGEASGDRLLAAVLAALRARVDVDAVGLGGDASAAAGLRLLAGARAVAAGGLVEAAAHLPAVVGAYRRLRSALDGSSAALLVDFPEVNRRLLERSRAPVAWLAPPQAWAWRPWRARAVARAAWVGCLLPFEAAWYRAHGVAAEWVGHPLAEASAPPPAAEPCVALLPGSRDGTVRRLLPVMLAAAIRAHRRRPRLRFTLAVASTVDRLAVRRAVVASDLPIALRDDAPAALAEATVAMAGAGTATLEATLAGRPVVALARLHPASAAVARRLVRVDHVALPNLVLGRQAFPERVQDACTPEGVAEALEIVLADPGRFSPDLAELHARMHQPGFAARAASRIAALL